MLIKCPKCRSVYDLPDNLIKEDGLQMRCAECFEIWTSYPEDALKKVSTAPKNIQKMFKRISKENDDLFIDAPITEDKNIERVRIINVSKKNYLINFILFVFIMLSLVLVLYSFRYDIVRFVPATEKFYSKLNINSVPYGVDLEFNNIVTKEYVENNISKIEINGMVSNKSKYVTEIPPVKIDIYDKNGKLLTSIEEKLSLPRLEPNYHLLFHKVVLNPTPYGKLIYVNFKEKQKLNF